MLDDCRHSGIIPTVHKGRELYPQCEPVSIRMPYDAGFVFTRTIKADRNFRPLVGRRCPIRGPVVHLRPGAGKCGRISPLPLVVLLYLGGTHAGSGDVRLSQSDLRFKLEASSSALARIVASGRYLERLAIPKSGRVVFIAEKDIDWIESEGNYVRLRVGEHQDDPRQTLTDLEQKLDRADFLRIHRSTIVNARPIKEIQAWFHGYHRVLLFDGPELRMSRYQHELARQLGLS
jgi:LytTr DNA-binding domain-containing protein